MPARSEAQRRYIYAHFGADWAKRHHFDNKGRLPKKVSHGKTRHPVTRDLVRRGMV